MVVDEPRAPFDPDELTVRELLAGYAAILASLRARGIVRTANAPVADLAEIVALRAYGGELAANSQRSFDLLTADNCSVQVKARVIARDDKRSHGFSAVRSWDFDIAVFLVFDLSYELVWARELTSAEARGTARRVEHTNSSLITLRSVLSAGRDVTPLLAAVYSQIDHPA